MKYVLLEKKQGVNANKMLEFDSEVLFEKILYYKDDMYILKSKDSIYFFDSELKIKKSFDSLFDICLNKSSLYVVYNNGLNIDEINLKNDYVTSLFKGNDLIKKISSKRECKNLSITCDSSILYISDENYNIIFCFKRRALKKHSGNGKNVFSISNNIQNCTYEEINNMVFNNDLYVLENNSFIRKIGENVSVFWGDYLGEKRDIKNFEVSDSHVWFSNGNEVFQYNLNNKNTVRIYNGLNIDMTKKGNDLIILGLDKNE
jgi:hypothetical protein